MSRYPQPGACRLILLLAALATSCWADDFTDKGRAIFQEHQQAVVTVQLMVRSRVSMTGMATRTNDALHSISGTVISPSGLTVLSLSATDPGPAMQRMAAAQDPRVKVETELSNVKILREDGTEVPAKLVLRDNDLDLAFIQPTKKPSTPIAALDLTRSGKAQVLDQVIALNRLGTAAGRVHTASVERIAAAVEQPRRFYVPDANMTTATLGAPAFTPDGKVLGVFVIRSIESKSAGGAMDTPGQNVTGIILPADQILKAAESILTAGEAQQAK